MSALASGLSPRCGATPVAGEPRVGFLAVRRKLSSSFLSEMDRHPISGRARYREHSSMSPRPQRAHRVPCTRRYRAGLGDLRREQGSWDKTLDAAAHGNAAHGARRRNLGRALIIRNWAASIRLGLNAADTGTSGLIERDRLLSSSDRPL